MKVSEHLFELVKSLSKTEKRYFKRFATLHGESDKDYIRLFDDLLKLSTYYEADLKGAYSKSYSGNFGMLKELLFQQVMKSLTVYHATSSIELEIVSLISEVKILQKKGLLDIANKKVTKGIKLCKEHERFGFMPILYSHKKSLIMQSFYANIKPTEIAKILAAEKEDLALQNELIAYVNLMFIFFYQDKNESKEQRKKNRDAIIKNPLVANVKQPQSFSAKSIRLTILSRYFEELSQSKDLVKTLSQHIQLYKAYPKIKKEYYFNFLNLNYNYINHLIEQKKYRDAEKLLREQQLQKHLNKGYEDIFFTLHYTTQVSLLAEQKLFYEIIAMQKLIEAELTHRGKAIPFQALRHFDYFFALSNFSLSNYEDAIYHLQQIINSKKYTNDVFAQARVLLLLCHYEIGNYNIITPLAESALRALININKEQVYVENIFMEQLLKHIKNNDSFLQNGFRINDFKQIKEVLVKQAMLPFIMASFKLTDWVQEKCGR